MAFLNELKKNLSGVSDTVAKTSETVMKRSGNVLEIQKAKLKKVSLEGDLKNYYAELGKLYFDNFADGDLPEDMAGLCEKITACQHAIAEAEQRVVALKGIVVCTNCQAEVDKEASYCPKCGAEIVHIVEDASSDAVDGEAVHTEEMETVVEETEAKAEETEAVVEETEAKAEETEAVVEKTEAEAEATEAAAEEDDSVVQETAEE